MRAAARCALIIAVLLIGIIAKGAETEVRRDTNFGFIKEAERTVKGGC